MSGKAKFPLKVSPVYAISGAFFGLLAFSARNGEEKMKLIYRPSDKPTPKKTLVFAIQQLLAIMAATIAVPAQINQIYPEAAMSSAAALFGAGAGTLIYLLFTKFKSPVFLGSSFAFIGSMLAAFGGAVTMYIGHLAFIIGAVLAGLVYVALAITVKYAGVEWINKLMPPVVIGPTVALIGLSLSSAAVNGIFHYVPKGQSGFEMTTNLWLTFICALVTLFVVVITSTYGKKMAKLIPFIIGILAGYAVALIFTVIGYIADAPSLIVIDFSPFKALVADGVTIRTFLDVPDFTFVFAVKGFKDMTWGYFATIAAAYLPVAFVVFAEHIADHKNLSSIIEEDLLKDPGLDKTLLGDGVGSMVGAFFGGCPNTTYGESVGCVAITKNASIITIIVTAFMSMGISFISPFVAFLSTIPACVMGGVCVTLYGFIAVSGLKMIQKVDLENSANLFTVSAILIPGIGGLALTIVEGVTITNIACALILGILVNVTLSTIGKKLGAKNNDEE